MQEIRQIQILLPTQNFSTYVASSLFSGNSQTKCNEIKDEDWYHQQLWRHFFFTFTTKWRHRSLLILLFFCLPTQTLQQENRVETGAAQKQNIKDNRVKDKTGFTNKKITGHLSSVDWNVCSTWCFKEEVFFTQNFLLLGSR